MNLRMIERLRSSLSLSTAEELYVSLFRLGEGFLQRSGEYHTHKGNGIVITNDSAYFTGSYWRTRLLFDDTALAELAQAQQSPGTLVNACSYYGHRKNTNLIHQCFGLIFDIDGVGESQIHEQLYQMSSKQSPTANYIAVSKSGEGIHLYYLFDTPITMYPARKIALKELKYKLTWILWNYFTSTIKEPQYQSYDQSFRIPEAKEHMQVFKLSDYRYSIEELSEFADREHPDGFAFDWSLGYPQSQWTLEEAKERFPDWYERRIVQGKAKRHYIQSKAVYEWWKRTFPEYARHGNRYFCLMVLAIMGVKCAVPFEDVKKDALAFVPFLNSKAEEYPFTEKDAISALDCYDEDFVRYPSAEITKKTGVPIKSQRRNGRPQKEHLKRARAVRDIDYPDGSWINKDGAPTKQIIVNTWRASNPFGSKADCHRATGLDPKTIRKWWD